jgi:subtilisin family serine protease
MSNTKPLSLAPKHTGEYIVKFKSGVSEGHIKSMQAPLGVKLVRNIDVDYGRFAVARPSSEGFHSTLSRLEKHPSIEYIEPNYIYYAIRSPEEGAFSRIISRIQFPLNAPKDKMFKKLWGLKNTGTNEPNGLRAVRGVDVDAIRAWKLSKGDRKIKIAVIDTGIDYNHPDLKDNMWVNEAEANGEAGVDDDQNGYIDDVYGYNFTDERTPDNPYDGHGHGTHCAGTIGASHNEIGVAGVMADVSLVAIKFLTDQGSGTTENAIKSVDYATKVGVDIMSNSWGGGASSIALKEAIQRANEKGILFVAAAGNSASNNDQAPHYPSNYDVDNVIAVAAHNASGTLATFSCYGKDTVDVAAPGRNILSTVKDGGYDVYSGTSMATPHVSGVLGLFLAHNEENLNVREIKERLIKTSVPSDYYNGKMVSEARVNAYNLLKNIRPVHYIPDPDAWSSSVLSEPFTVKDYKNNETFTKEIVLEEEAYVRLVIKDFDTEKGYDILTIKTDDGFIVDGISGKIEEYKSSYVKAKKLILQFKSDFSNTASGFHIDEIETNSNVIAKP